MYIKVWQDHGMRQAADEGGEELRDGRLRRGARSRRLILRHAVDVASLEGLDGLSFGRLAQDLRISKSGVQTLFASKEGLQVATAELARELFSEAVVQPAETVPHGVERLRALVEQWIDYAQTPLFAGGCFWAANLADFDSRPGAVQEILVSQQRGWRRLLHSEFAHALDATERPVVDTELAAFELDATLIAANTAMRLGEKHAADRVRRVLDRLVAPAELGP
jgi:AcrR family transcriptional regulator